MITGITHLTMESERSRGMETAAGLGFWPDIVDDVVLPAGFEATGDDEGVLPLALLSAPRGLRLEVVAHSYPSKRRGAWCGLFAGPPPSKVGRVLARQELGERLRQGTSLGDPVCVELDVGGNRDRPPAEAWFDMSGCATSSGLAGLLGRTTDVLADASFWATFARVRWDRIDNDVAYGQAPLPMPRQTCTIVLSRDETSVEPFSMNDAGFPSVGVHSTAVQRDCAKALALGATMRASPIVTSVGGQKVRMALVSAPGGAPVELLAVERASRGQ